MKSKSSLPTMKDVAKEAGVALGTVSKVINGLPVGEAYRIKVEEAANRLGYPIRKKNEDPPAQPSRQVAVILPSLTHPYFALLAEHLINALSRRNCFAMIQTTDSEFEAERASVLAMNRQNVDGIIALTYASDISIDENIPFVSIDRFYSNAVPCITSDNFGGGQMAAKKLAELGCKKLLFLRIGDHTIGEPDKREAGFKVQCMADNIPHETVHLYDEQGYEPFYDFLKAHCAGGKLEFDGISCCTDYLAANIMAFLRKTLHLSVPGDVQVIGFDGLVNFLDGQPLCSSIVQPVDRIAELAVDTLLSADRAQAPMLTCLPVAYRPGGTTKDS